MMIRLFTLLLLLTACAKPRYADDSPATGTGGHGAGAETRDGPCFRSGPCLTLAWEKPPTEDDFGAFTFRTARAGAPADLDPAPSVVLWMPSMGHGSSPVRVTRLGVGEYRAEKVFFSMHGDWEIRFQLRSGQEVKDELDLPYAF